jgi:hypothetical protein
MKTFATVLALAVLTFFMVDAAPVAGEQGTSLQHSLAQFPYALATDAETYIIRRLRSDL